MGAARRTIRLFSALAALGAVAVVPGVRAAADNPTTLRLASQTPWVTPGQVFQLRVLLTPDPGLTGQLSVTVFARVANRTEYTRTLTNQITNATVMGRPLTVPLSELAPDAAGGRDVLVPTQDPTQRRDPAKLLLPGTGVYPVRVVFRPDDGSPQVVLVTHLVYLSGPIIGGKLSVSWIVPIHVPPHPGPDGTDQLTSSESDDLAALAAALDSHRSVPLVLAPTPDTLNAMAASPREQDRATLAILASRQPQHQVVSGGYVPLSLPGMIGAGLTDDATVQLTRGTDVLAANLHVRPDGRTWVESGAMDEGSATFLRNVQVDHLVVPDESLSPNPLPVTLAQPFDLVVHPGTTIRAAAADPGLAAHFASTPDPVLAAHQLLADLTVIYLDRPGQTRGVVINTPRTWQPSDSFLATFLDGLSASPMLSVATLDTLFATVAPASVARGVTMTRTLVPDARIPREVASFPADTIRAAQRRLTAFDSTLADDNPLRSRLQGPLLVAESADLVELRDRQAQLDVLNHHIDAQLALVQLPSARTITLTAQTGHLPVTILSGADYSLRVVLRLQSDKLSFPNSKTGTASYVLDVHKGNNPVQFQVRTRTPASFPLHITLLTADGRMIMSATTFTVQSTALSGMGIILTFGAGLFLALWWGRQILRSRSSKRQRPAEPPPPPLAAPPMAGRIRRLTPVPHRSTAPPASP